MRDLVRTFEKEFLALYYETKERFQESIKLEQLGIAKDNQTLSESLKIYLDAKLEAKKAGTYIVFLQNQVNLIDSFFEFTESTR